MKKTKVAILGYGGIARSHRKGYQKLKEAGAPVELVALCDVDPRQFEAEVAINLGADSAQSNDSLHLYSSFEELLAGEPDLDTVDICLPTYLHAEYAIRALEAGLNVQSEKPMALCEADCAAMIAAAEKSGKRLMIGQCLRFDNGYRKIREIIEGGKYGKVIAVRMHRYSIMPLWGYENWFSDYSRSGGVTLDMSIHDIDMARFLFGEPQSVTAVSAGKIMPHQWTQSSLIYADGKVVTIASSWLEGNLSPFSYGVRIVFEHASLVWGGEPAVKVFPIADDGHAPVEEYPIEKNDYMAAESRYFAELVLGIRNTNDTNPPESAMTTVRLVEAVKQSAENGGIPVAFHAEERKGEV